jgi:hypothetical protein
MQTLSKLVIDILFLYEKINYEKKISLNSIDFFSKNILQQNQ